MASFSFDDTINKLRVTPRGKEASMYGPIRDLLIHVLGYTAGDVDIDTVGEGGRPDVTARAPSGLVDSKGKQVKIDWIVVEAKDERGCFLDPKSREEIFANKSKYIGTNTAWFVMIEPEVLIARQVTGNDFAIENDIAVQFDGLSRQDFARRLDLLKHSLAGVPNQLKRFREGDMRLVACEKLSKPPIDAPQRTVNRYRVTRKRFYESVREVTGYLQDATRSALQRAWPEIKRFQALADDFGEKYKERGRTYKKWSFNPHLLTISASPQGPDASRQHHKDAVALRVQFKKNPYVVRLALDGIPSFQARTGAKDENLAELFSIESANLILARILLLRFFEDNGFFGEVRYVCNGGVNAFQEMRRYFKASYTRLLEEAYRHAAELYAAAFEETEMDWILGVNDQGFSNSIEWAMFQLSRYDFATIKGDILTGIYDRFMDRAQRKKLGEFYTPPSIARYIINRVGITRDSRVIDPACGSGTFLIEAYRAMVGDDIDRGAAEYRDAVDTLRRIAGNDLNTFSSVLAQIQLLWQVLGMRQEIETDGFPEIMVTGKVNSLVTLDQLTSMERFGELSQPIYDAVIGNPPYVRVERSAQELDDVTIADFARGINSHSGISAKLNDYALFIYKALSSWCKPMDDSGTAGRLGFIIPVSLFDANETENLRNLFRVGGRWTILEIIDLEIIYRQIFDADVLPAIIIIENRTATDDDVVSIRLANNECVKQEQSEALPSFELENLPEQKIPYSYLFTPDGRIMTRLTKERLTVIKKIWQFGTMRDAAKTYWRGNSKAAKGKVTDLKPDVIDLHNWSERQMLARGVVFRNKKSYKPNDGYTVYKGENIIAAELQGNPVERDVDLDGISDNSLWSVGSILPTRGFAIARVAHCVNAVAFDSTKVAFTDTATLFFPREDLSCFPFDILLLSDIYVFFYAIAARMGVLRTLRSDIYPTNFAVMPWSEYLINVAPHIEALRLPLVDACHRRFQARESLQEDLAALTLPTLKDFLRNDKSSHIIWSECFDQFGYEAEIDRPRCELRNADEIQVFLSSNMLEWLELNRRDLAEGLVSALRQQEGVSLTKGDILNLPIPVSLEELEMWNSVTKEHQEEKLEKHMAAVLNELNQLVGKAFALDVSEITFVQKELSTDPFLKGIRPRYPGTVTRKQGLRTGLSSSKRYQ